MNWGRLQTESMVQQGAEIKMGSSLNVLFQQIGLTNIYTDVLESETDQRSGLDDSLEWRVLRSDLKGTVSEEDLMQFELYEQDARANGERVLVIPTYYAHWLGQRVNKFRYLLAKSSKGGYNITLKSGRGAVRLARLHGV